MFNRELRPLRLKVYLLLLAVMFAMTFVGCKQVTTAHLPRAPGYVSTMDQTMGESLAAAHAFYNSIQQQSAAGTMTLSATEKAAFNTFGVTLNGAQTVYLAYHANPTAANETAARNAVNQVQSQQAALPQPKGN